MKNLVWSCGCGYVIKATRGWKAKARSHTKNKHGSLAVWVMPEPKEVTDSYYNKITKDGYQ